MPVALAGGLALVAVAVGGTLSRPPVIIAGTNSVAAQLAAGHTRGDTRGCQQGGTLPGGTAAIRLSLSANVGPKVALNVRLGSRVVTRGERDAGWGEEETVSVPVARVARTTPGVVVCTTVGPTIESLQINGTPKRPTPSGALGLRDVLLRIEYLRPGHRSWWSLASSVAYHMGLGHAPSGAWIVFLLLVLMFAVAALASQLVVRELR
ncbi:MAG TPA: hypothetical protein VFG23_00105 [Polyangia bacterium]|nr:hypothetical protein [Polyangia bacterium]